MDRHNNGVRGWAALLALSIPLAVAVVVGTTPMTAQAQAERAPQRYALVVGISDYAGGTHPEDRWRDLKTQGDVARIQEVLTASYGFTEANMEVLVDAQATQANIVASFEELAEKARPGDTVVFYYSGHGHQVPDREDPGNADPIFRESADAITGLDEALVTFVPGAAQMSDMEARHDAMYLRDDVFNNLLDDLTEAMSVGGEVQGNITLIFDSCHSGTMTRGQLVAKGREYDPAIDGEPASPATGGDGGEFARSRTGQDNVVILSAARADQFAYQVTFPDVGPMGVLTYYLTAEMERLAIRQDEGVSYQEIFDAVVAYVQSGNYGQDPQLEGSIYAPLFGDGEVQMQPQARVFDPSSDGSEAKISWGRVHGVNPGSTFAVMDGATKIATATVTESRFDESSVTIAWEAGQGPVPLTAKAATPESLALALEKLAVSVPAGDPIAAALSGQPYIEVVERGQDVALALERTAGQIVITRYGGASDHRTGQAQTAIPDGPNQASEVLSRVLAEWRWQSLAALGNDSAGAPQYEVRFSNAMPGFRVLENGAVVDTSTNSPLMSFDPMGDLRGEGGVQELYQDDSAYLFIRNNSGRDLYFYVLALQPDGAIDLVYPALGTTNEIVIGDGTVRAVLNEVGSQGPVFGTTLVKVIASREPVDLTALQQEGSRGVLGKGDNGDLANFLFSVADGTSRSLGGRPMRPDSWSTLTVPLITRAGSR